MNLIKPTIAVAFGGLSSFVGYGLLFGNEQIYSNYVMPTIQKFMDGEKAHNFAIYMAKYNLVPFSTRYDNEEILKVDAFNKIFSNPIGCAAGFDKNADALSGLFKIGFGFVEVGTITPEPQPGNPKPRVFRLEDDMAVINRYGFNSEGHKTVLEKVHHFKLNKKNDEHILGINIGKNKLSTDAVEDYLKGIKAFEKYADYIVINISSPNTPGLRSLQNKKELEGLIDPILELRNKLNKNLPILVKIAPDLGDQELKDIASVLTRKNKAIDGLIVSNTTIERPKSLKSESKNETGGLSGRPLKEKSNDVLKRMYELTNGQITLIGVGGIENGRDALERIKNGASLIQVYTAMVYQGPIIVNKLKRELLNELKREGFSNIKEAIGYNFKEQNINKNHIK